MRTFTLIKKWGQIYKKGRPSFLVAIMETTKVNKEHPQFINSNQITPLPPGLASGTLAVPKWRTG